MTKKDPEEGESYVGGWCSAPIAMPPEWWYGNLQNKTSFCFVNLEAINK